MRMQIEKFSDLGARRQLCTLVSVAAEKGT